MAGLWTTNILTTPQERTMVSNNVLEISDIDCYVQDDLAINGIGDKVVIDGGNYYGYGSGSGIDSKAESNSAINVNAKDIELTIRDLDTLWLAGQSFVSIPKGYGEDPIGGTSEQLAVPQGESLSFKGVCAISSLGNS